MNMNLQQILLILAARWKVVLLVLIGTVAVTLGITSLLPKQYTATATVIVDSRSPDPIATVLMQSGMVPQLTMATQVDIIKSDRVARRAVKMLKLDENDAVKQEWIEATGGQGRLDVWLAALFLKKLTAKQPARDSSLISITFEAADPGVAEAVANAFAQAYIDVNVELKVEPAKQYMGWFALQSQLLRETLEKAQAKLSKFQQEKGIVASDEARDNETVKLGALSAQLTTAQGQTADATGRQNSGDAADTLPEIAQHPVITALKADITRQEAKLQESSVNLGKNHPQYRRIEAELAVLKDKLRFETQHLARGFSTSRGVSSDKQAELKAAIKAQRTKLLQIKIDRDELAVLQRDVDAAKKAFEAVANRLNQASLDSQATQTNVAVLTPAVAPIRPSSPKITMFALLGIAAGAMLGIAAACLPEMLNPRIRSTEALAGMPQLPVLGVIERPRARGRRLIPWQRRRALAIR
jgi:succinoglycan biosynthesis transport protein ExoP